MTAVVVLVSALLAAVAAAGVLRPFRASPAPSIEPPTDPLAEERRSVLASLRDLDEEHATGALEDETYRRLRAETEARAVAVLRTIEGREGAGALAEEAGTIRRPGPEGSRPRRTGRTAASAALIAAALAAAVVPLLWGALGERAPGQPITGQVPGGPDPISFFEQRVREHPDDLAARLDLGQRYLEAGRAEDAVEQYVEALRIDRRNAEAHAQLGFVLYRAGRPQEGLRAIDQALELDPGFPLALYYRGLILLDALDRPDDAAEAFRAYLREAPFGSFRDDARTLLDRAER